MTNVTYITVLQVIEAFAANHLQIKRFHSDFPDNIPDFSNEKEDFPILFVSPTNSVFQVNTNLFNIRVYCFDLITEGRENINSILSDTNSILSDLNTYLTYGNLPAIDVLQNSNITPINNALLDYAAGWYMDISLEVLTSGLCEIPFSTPPIITDSICNTISFGAGVPTTRKLTIADITYDLSADRVWDIFTGTTNQFIKADGSYDDTVYENSANKQNNLFIDNTGVKFPTVDAVNVSENSLANATLNTGFLQTNDAFTLAVVDDFNLGISASTFGIIFKPLLNTSPFSYENSIVNITERTIPLSQAGLGFDGTFVKFVGYRQSDDSILFSDNQFHQTPTVCQLGLVLIKFSGGTTSFIDVDRNIVNKPDIAGYSNLETTKIGLSSTVSVAPAPSNDLKIVNSDGSLIGISTNWHGSNNDKLDISENLTGTSFTYISAALATNSFPISATTFIDPTLYFDGFFLVPVPATDASVQRFLLTVKGTIVVQYGEQQYVNFDEAKNNIFVAPFTDILPAGSAVEIGRIAVKENATNLENPNQAFFVVTGGGGAGGSNTAVVNWGNITGDITNQTDLVNYIYSATTGTTNFISKFDSTGLTESNITDNGSLVNILSNVSGGTYNNLELKNYTGSSNIVVGSVAQLVTSASTNNIGLGKNLNFAPNCSNGILIGNGSALFSQDTILIGSGLANIQAFTTKIGHATTTDTLLGGNVRAGNAVYGNAIIKNGGLPTEFLMADGSVTTGSSQTISGTTNVLPKFTSTGLTNSRISDDGSIVTISGVTEIRGSIGGQRLYFGSGAGGNRTSNSNLGIGNNALNAAGAGIQNTAIGHNALLNDLGGGNNVAVGAGAVQGNTGGNFNVGVGSGSLQQNTLAGNNTAIGHQTFINLNGTTSASGNTALGFQAGNLYNSLQDTICIGINANPQATNQVNQIVIGTKTIGNGSNTTVIGNTSTTGATIYGNLTSNAFIKSGGTSTQFLMADGSVTTGSTGGGSISGTTNFIPKFTGSTVGNSQIFDDGNTVVIGSTSPNASAILQLDTTTKGFLIPRMTQVQRQNITPIQGLKVYQTDGQIGEWIYTNFGWNNLGIANINIAPVTSITTDTTDVDGLRQYGRNVMISNGANVINITTQLGSEPNFVSSYTKLGTGAITFVAGASTTLTLIDGTAVLNGAIGSTATLTRSLNTYYLRIANV